MQILRGFRCNPLRAHGLILSGAPGFRKYPKEKPQNEQKPEKKTKEFSSAECRVTQIEEFNHGLNGQTRTFGFKIAFVRVRLCRRW
jgi:hypothetical protein